MAVAIEEVAVGRLKVAEDNVRMEVGDVGELAQSIKSGGVLQPLIVREGDYLVVAGARRLAAAKMAGLKVVPVIARQFTEQERLETMIVENAQREDLTPIEEANAYKRLVDLGLTQREIATRVGRAQGTIAKRLALLALPEKVQKEVDSGGITLPDAAELAKLKDDPKLVAKLAKSNPNGYGRSISQKVGEEVAKRQKDKERAARVAELKKQGVNVVDAKTDAYGYSVQLPDGMAEVKAQTYNKNDVEMDPKKHAKLDCHAIAVNPHSLKEIAVCTNPKAHPSRADQLKAEEQKRQAEAKQREEAFDKLTERRRQFVRELIAARPDKDAVLELVFAVLIYDGSRYYGNDEDAAMLTLDLLGIDVEKTAEAAAAKLKVDEVEVTYLIEQEAEKSAAARLRVTFALAAAQFERMLTSYGSWLDEEQYFVWLQARGYKLVEDEKQRLAGRPNA